MALRARSTDLASISSAIAYNAMTIAASGHWPIRKSTGDGDRHQGVDVQPSVPKRAKAFAVGG